MSLTSTFPGPIQQTERLTTRLLGAHRHTGGGCNCSTAQLCQRALLHLPIRLCSGGHDPRGQLARSRTDRAGQTHKWAICLRTLFISISSMLSMQAQSCCPVQESYQKLLMPCLLTLAVPLLDDIPYVSFKGNVSCGICFAGGLAELTDVMGKYVLALLGILRRSQLMGRCSSQKLILVLLANNQLMNPPPPLLGWFHL